MPLAYEPPEGNDALRQAIAEGVAAVQGSLNAATAVPVPEPPAPEPPAFPDGDPE